MRGGAVLRGVLIGLIALACHPGEQRPPAPTEPAAGPAAPETPSEAPARIGSPNARPGIVEELRAFRDAPHHPSDGQGRAWLDWPEGGPPALEAGGRGRFPLVFEVGDPGIAEGGWIFLQVSPFWGWSQPQVDAPEAPGYTEVSTGAEGVRLEAAPVDDRLLGIHVGEGPLRAGERVRIVYGAGPARARVDPLAERESRFFFAVDGDGDGVRRFIADAPAVEIGPGPPAALVAFLPAVARPGETVSLSFAALDDRGNAGVDLEGEVAVEPLPDGLALAGAGRIALGADDGGRGRIAVVAREAGLYRLRVRGPQGLAAESNPMAVSASGPRVLFADLHGHSSLSDGTGTPEDWYRYARDVAALDVAALTDHDHWGFPFLDETPAHWQRIQDATRRFHEPGRFVTLLGYEWTSWTYGHRHVLHFEDEAPLRSFIAEETDTPAELWAALGDAPALTFAHHSAGEPVATDWSIPPDPRYEPVTEIVSVHGSSESPDTPDPVRGGIEGNWVRDALGRGYRLGFVGSGDGHDGHPGLTRLWSGRGGLAGLLSEERTREGVLAALRARRSFATNGPRIVLLVRLDDAWMGSALPAAEAHRLVVSVAAPAAVEAVEVVADGRVIDRVPGEGRRDLAFESTFGPAAPGGTLYLRVLQEDGGAAWSSPFFFE